MELNKFKENYMLDIMMDVEEDYKGLKYLSWASAYKLAMERDSAMSYTVFQSEDGMPFFSRGEVHIVKTQVTMFGESKEMFLPIMDNKHNSVAKPNSRQVNDNIMRCLAKNIAMFGVGLPLYVGEDLKQFKSPSKEDLAKVESLRNEIKKGLKEEDDTLLTKMLAHYKKSNIDLCSETELLAIKRRLEKERMDRENNLVEELFKD